jgi:hypothetical protein
METISSSQFGLSNRVKLKFKDNNIIIVKQRKSRIIMKDSKQILDIANKIRAKEHGKEIKLLISGPICSKSIKNLNENNIEIIS